MKKSEEASPKISTPSLLKNYCVIISSIVVILAGLHAARTVLGPFLMATFFAVLLVSPLNWLKNRGLAGWLAMTVVITGVLLVGGGAATIVGSQIAQFARDIPEYRHRFITTLESYNLDLGDVIPFLKEPEEEPSETPADEEKTQRRESETESEADVSRSPASRRSRDARNREREENVVDDVAEIPTRAPLDEKIAASADASDSRDAPESTDLPTPSVENAELATADSEIVAAADENVPLAENGDADALARPAAPGRLSPSELQETRLIPKTPPEILKDGSLFSDDSNPAYDDNFDPYVDVDGPLVGKNQALNAVKLSSQQLFRFLGGLAGELSYFASTALIVTLLLVFMLVEGSKLPKKLAAAFGLREFKDRRVLGVLSDIRHYMAIKTEMSLLVGVLVTALMFLTKVQYPLLWGFVAFLLNYIPNIGSVVAAIPPIVLATVEHGVAIGCVDAAAFVVINCVVGYVLEPKLLGQGLDLSPLIVLIALIFFGWLLGPVGMFLSPPLAVVMKIIFVSFPETRWIAALMANRTPYPSDGADDEAELNA